MNDTSKYAALEDYALIGDCHGSALISRNGSVDWCCLVRFDSDPSLFRILDREKGGFFEITPQKTFKTERSYLGRTNILKTSFHGEGGSLVELTDYMPVGRSSSAGTYDYVSLSAPFWLIRSLKAKRGAMSLRIRYKPTRQFGLEPAPISRRAQFLATPKGPFLYGPALEDFKIEENCAEAVVHLKEGEELTYVLTPSPQLNQDVLAKVPTLFEKTQAFWEEWSDFCRYVGPHKQQVLRSALTLKLLTYAPTGAIVAAPTTSLPESLGGSRNYDYRYCWIRDASFTLYALTSLGYSGEANQFARFVQACCKLSYPELEVVYGVGGETDLIEKELDHLEGYQCSQPVRTGNKAHEQSQLDIFGSLQEGFAIYQRIGGRLDDSIKGLIEMMANLAMDNWEKPDHGLWEMRSEPRHHLYSKIMCWVAVDRASHTPGLDREKYKDAADRMLTTIKEQGIDPKEGWLKGTYGESGADASLLRVVLTALPLDDQVFRATVKKIEADLGRKELLLRYQADDGLEGDEGAFLTCSFWMVSALLRLGEYERAKEKFEFLLSLGNDLGLFPEEMDPEKRTFLGNFPQGLTHLALIESAVNLEIYREQGKEALRGNLADRIQRSVGASVGLSGVVSAYNQTGRLGRIFSSKKSKLPQSENSLN